VGVTAAKPEPPAKFRPDSSNPFVHIAADLRIERAAEAPMPPGELGFSVARTLRFNRDPLPTMLDAYERFGPVYTLRLMHAPVVFMLGPAANHHVTVSHASNFLWREGSMGDLIALLGDGLLTIDGAEHRRARRLALRVAMRALFGLDPDRAAGDVDLAEEFERALAYYGRDYFLQSLRGPRSPWRALQASRRRLDRVLFTEIARRRKRGADGEDILSLLLAATDEDGSALTDRQVRDQVITLLFAGHDTTTSTVAFLFYELARNPGEQPPLLEELDKVLDGRRPTAAELVGELPRLETAMDETLRMYPPAWIGPRRAIHEYEFEGHVVPAGARVNYCSWASHHLADVFENPFAFVPERFAPERKALLPKGAYVPFGGGSRTCVGMRFGQLEIMAIAATLLQRFTLELQPGYCLRIREMPTLSPRDGLPMIVRARGA